MINNSTEILYGKTLSRGNRKLQVRKAPAGSVGRWAEMLVISTVCAYMITITCLYAAQ